MKHILWEFHLDNFLKKTKKFSSENYYKKNYPEWKKDNFDDFDDISPKDFYRHQVFLINDCVDSAKKIIVDMIDTSSLEDLKKAKIILNKIIKVSKK